MMTRFHGTHLSLRSSSSNLEHFLFESVKTLKNAEPKGRSQSLLEASLHFSSFVVISKMEHTYALKMRFTTLQHRSLYLREKCSERAKPRLTLVTKMAKSETSQSIQRLPEVLLIRKPPVFKFCGEQSIASDNFRYLKAYQSSLPLDQFLTDHTHSVQAILCTSDSPVTADLLRLLPEVRAVVTTSVGVDQVDLSECRRRGIKVANAGSVYSANVADLAVGLLIDVMRKISAGNRYVKQGLCSTNGDYPLGCKLRGKRVGIVGLGGIGNEVAKRLEAFGCRISYNSRNQKPSVSYHFCQEVLELAADSDVLIICCALNDQTHHLIDKQVLSALGKEGFIVNVGRGPIIDEKELVSCLMNGEIAGAGLDVFENEPNVPQELFVLDNVVMYPHSAVFTPEAFRDLSELLVGNLEAAIANKPLLSELKW
ncbi:hypothetical protein K2173_024890 [Erythroxylum novogranatense]|uniref:glyoxylate reductase (NADP(+)) n=1 Tax=Erythroxylum novogranatense TaxID=1862640 RepID=A0AAV8UCF1_9ROSI|nr:hypothetical protein K2173_024890 [Erythroxylum novogranatense]